MKILIVDDDPLLLNLLKTYLSQWYKVFTVLSAEQGISVFKEISPSVVITDIKMPYKSGIDFLKDIRAINTIVPIILMTGHVETNDAIEAIKYGGWDFLQKPINPPELKVKIDLAFKHYAISLDRKILEDTFDALNETITLHDLNFNIVKANKAALELLKTSDILGQRCYKLFHMTEIPHVMCPGYTAMKDKRFVRHEFFEPSIAKYLEVKAYPRLDEDNEVIGFVHIVNDITALKEAEKIKADFISNLSHELRTPLNAILGLSEFLLSDTDNLQPHHLGHLKMISNAGKNLLSLVEQLLAFSKPSCPEGRQINVLIDMRRFLKIALQSFEVKALEKNIFFQYDIPTDVISDVKVNPGALHELLSYIVDNAIKFTLSGGVTIRLSNPSKTELTISIIDTGIGMSDEVKGAIFKDFVQGDSSKTRLFCGLGTGLCIAHKLAQTIGCNIQYESELNKGTIFHLTMPLFFTN